MDIRKIFFPRRVVQPQQVSREVGNLHPLEVFEAWIDEAVTTLI